MKKYLTYIVPASVLALLAVLLWQQGMSWRDLQTVLKYARWEWLLLALVWQAASYGAVTRLNQIILRHYGADVPWSRQYVIQLAMAFIEAAVPSATVSGAVLRVRLLKPYGVSADVATISTAIEMGLVTLSVALLALPMVGAAAFMGQPGGTGLASGLLALGVLSVLMGVLFNRRRDHRLIQFGRHISRRLIDGWDQHIRARWPRHLSDWPGQRLMDRGQYLGRESVSLFRARPYAISINLLARSGFEFFGLMMCFYALGQPLPVLTMLLIYTLTIAVNSLGAIPGGIGLAEVSLAVLYTQYGVPSQTAVVIALAYRLTDYWLPRLAGGLAWLWLEQKFPGHIPQEAAPQ